MRQIFQSWIDFCYFLLDLWASCWVSLWRESLCEWSYRKFFFLDSFLPHSQYLFKPKFKLAHKKNKTSDYFIWRNISKHESICVHLLGRTGDYYIYEIVEIGWRNKLLISEIKELNILKCYLVLHFHSTLR